MNAMDFLQLLFSIILTLNYAINIQQLPKLVQELQKIIEILTNYTQKCFKQTSCDY